MKKLSLFLALVMLLMSTAFAATPTGENEFPLADETVELTVWCSTIAGRDYWNCDMTKFLQEKMGIKINFDQYTGDANTAYNLMLAADEWPDIFLGVTFSPLTSAWALKPICFFPSTI